MRRYFIAGLLVWIPISVTYFVLRLLIELLDGSLAMIPKAYQPDQLFGQHIPGLGLVFTLVVIFFTGLLAANIVGGRLVAAWERLLARIPIIRSIYSAVKQVIHAFVTPKSDSFRKVVLIQYPRKEVWSIGFQTSGNFKHSPVDEQMITAFVPTTPNPTSGFLVIVPAKDTIELEMSVEEAFKMIISLGVVTPQHTVQSHQTS